MSSTPSTLEPQENNIVALLATYHALLVSVRAEAAEMSANLRMDTIIRTGEALERMGQATALEKRVEKVLTEIQGRCV